MNASTLQKCISVCVWGEWELHTHQRMAYNIASTHTIIIASDWFIQTQSQPSEQGVYDATRSVAHIEWMMRVCVCSPAHTVIPKLHTCSVADLP